jgi:hypothetical protein
VAAIQAAPEDSKSASPDTPVSSPALGEQPKAPSEAEGRVPQTPAVEPGSRGEPAPGGQEEAVSAPASQAGGTQGLPALMVLQGLAGGLVAMLSLATGLLWWRHRTTYR